MKNSITTFFISLFVLANGYAQDQAIISGKLESIFSNFNSSLFTVILKDLTEGSEQTKVLDDSLKYTFTAIKGHTYDLSISLDSTSALNNHLNGVSTLDIVLIIRHILGLQNFENPIQLIAADINNDAKITTSDIVELRKLILGINNGFTSTRSWIFVIKESLSNPFNFVYIENGIRITNLQNDLTKQDFLIIKIGDVSGNATGG